MLFSTKCCMFSTVLIQIKFLTKSVIQSSRFQSLKLSSYFSRPHVSPLRCRRVGSRTVTTLIPSPGEGRQEDPGGRQKTQEATY